MLGYGHHSMSSFSNLERSGRVSVCSPWLEHAAWEEDKVAEQDFVMPTWEAFVTT
jgi:hypothetical protein